MAHAIKVARVDAQLTIEELRVAAGIAESTMNRILAGTRDINVTQIVRLAGAMRITPQQLVKNAVKKAGGMEALMSEVTSTQDDIATKRKQKEAEAMTPEQLGALKHAATTDPEMDTDEPE